MTNTTNQIIIDYHKRFVYGEQHLQLIKSSNGEYEIQETSKDYYWQERAVYNHISPLIQPYLKDNPTKEEEEALFGEHGLVSLLIPFQRAYNAIKNREIEYLNRCTMGVMAVEDGSVDVDELCEDGICPGKVIVYRQGGEAPILLSQSPNTESFINSAENCLDNMRELAKNFKLRLF